MKRVLTMVLCLVLALSCVGILAACHKHTYDETKWEKDATHHWRPVTCEHTDAVEKVEHSFDANGKCTVCSYQKAGTQSHTHTFAKGWTSDATHHWHKATCEHTTEQDGYAPHTPNAFGRCTVCDYQGEVSFNGSIDDAKWKAALAALADINNFTMSMNYYNAGVLSAVELTEIEENVIHDAQLANGMSYHRYRIYSEDVVTRYEGMDGAWDKREYDVEDVGSFEEELEDTLEDLLGMFANFDLENNFDQFDYDQASGSYVWEINSNGWEKLVVRFVGDSIYYACAINGSTESGEYAEFVLDKIGNTSIELEPLHQHEYSSVWSSNSLYHWHDALCHEGEVDEKVAHSWGSDNKCTVCGHAKSDSVNTQVDEETFVKALAVKGLTNWTLSASMSGVEILTMQRDGDKFSQVMFGEIGLFLAIDDNGKVWQYVETDKDVWEKVDMSDEVDADMARAAFAMLLGNFNFLADYYDELTYSNGVYTATDVTISFIHPLLNEVEIENATIELIFNDGEIVYFKLVQMDGEDEVQSAEFVVGQTTITLPNAKVHEHEWEISADEDEHKKECPLCGNETEWEKHTYDADGVCTVCGAKNHKHNYVIAKPMEDDTDMHTYYCECGVRSFNAGEHEFDETDHCIECGAERHIHVGNDWHYDEYAHYGECDICQNKVYQNHYYSNGIKCDVCGYERHVHNLVDGDHDLNSHWGTCSDPNCPQQGEQFGEDHIWGANKGNCIVCGAEYHEHTFVWNEDNNYNYEEHELRCTNSECDRGRWERHTFDSDNKCTVCGAEYHEHAGTTILSRYPNEHGILCEECGNEFRDDHNYIDGVCDVCGVKDHKHMGSRYQSDGTEGHNIFCECGAQLEWDWHEISQLGEPCSFCGYIIKLYCNVEYDDYTQLNTAITLYANNVAYVEEYDDEEFSYRWVDDTTLVVSYQGVDMYIFSVDLQERRVYSVNFNELTPNATYTGNDDGETFTVKLYDNGFLVITYDEGGTLVSSYHIVDGNKIETLYFDMIINGDTVTVVDED